VLTRAKSKSLAPIGRLIVATYALITSARYPLSLPEFLKLSSIQMVDVPNPDASMLILEMGENASQELLLSRTASSDFAVCTASHPPEEGV